MSLLQIPLFILYLFSRFNVIIIIIIPGPMMRWYWTSKPVTDEIKEFGVKIYYFNYCDFYNKLVYYYRASCCIFYFSVFFLRFGLVLFQKLLAIWRRNTFKWSQSSFPYKLNYKLRNHHITPPSIISRKSAFKKYI